MSLTMYDASVPVFTRKLRALGAIFEKADVFAEARRIDRTVLLGLRLYPDMLPLMKQVQIATDHAKGATARLAGLPVPSFEDSETTMSDVQARIAKTLAFLASVDPMTIVGSEARPITIRSGGGDRNFSGQDYLLGYAMPNFFFHITTAYGILRHAGLEIGKGDFMKAFPN